MQTVIITGSAKRLGRGLAIEFAKKGWNIILHYNSSQDEAIATAEQIRAFGVKVFPIQFDLSNYQAIEEGFEKIKAEFSFPNVLINNAGIFPPLTTLQDITPESWDSIMKVNLNAHLYTSKFFTKYAADNSRIINIASVGGLEVWKHRIPYNVSKAGVIKLTKVLAKELAPRFSVNSISPGTITFEKDPVNDSAEKYPMKRFATVQDIFEAIYFFATATNYITGQNICVDGGFTLK
ncbi:MAG: SDR family oxidoreductase [Candidatus Kapabacteria bacterium]|jgi:NAD(P)-dependent dehydrogenase (short-subunit alcohol dehydrogenase family)|nr:SDR family oxidoreductase [Candidatus Kapabacteria bacterium]